MPGAQGPHHRGGRSRQLGLDQRLAEKTEVSCLPAYTVVLWQVQATGCSLGLPEPTLQPRCPRGCQRPGWWGGTALEEGAWPGPGSVCPPWMSRHHPVHPPSADQSCFSYRASSAAFQTVLGSGAHVHRYMAPDLISQPLCLVLSTVACLRDSQPRWPCPVCR